MSARFRQASKLGLKCNSRFKFSASVSSSLVTPTRPAAAAGGGHCESLAVVIATVTAPIMITQSQGTWRRDRRRFAGAVRLAASSHAASEVTTGTHRLGLSRLDICG
jgi:hypothetical protein